MFNTIALEAKGDGDLLNALRLKNLKTGEESDMPVNGLFYAIGELPSSPYSATWLGLTRISKRSRTSNGAGPITDRLRRRRVHPDCPRHKPDERQGCIRSWRCTR